MDKFGQSERMLQKKIAENEKKRKFEIGGAAYLVTAHYKEQGDMTATDKVARLIDRDTETA
ncbi:hypothetical protein [Eisenbergiella tayi]|uniref:hypothetical protein n=1 Tax=Eisenbergiella tayi TaxID=1432052 RepID=UPI0008490BD0|nr:hypothetical protein [Eisenbergiella tayi]ODR33870.1 hypothetical protein BEI60_23520 [Eisenbergiella tayi]